VARPLKAFDAAKTGVAALVALCIALLKKTTRSGLKIIGEMNLEDSVETLHSPVEMVKIAVKKVGTVV